jgi:hypothetical protein
VLRSLQSLISVIALAQAGAAGSITLAAGASAVNDYYKGQTICIVTGTGAGQARACYAYNGGTKVASTRPDWATNPDNTSYYAILNVGSSVVAAIEDIDLSATMKASVNTEVDNALDTAIPGAPTANSVNERVKAIDDKLPTNYIMGSSVTSNMDDEINNIEADTDELQTDWTNGGRLDLLVDGIKAVTDTLVLADIADAVHDEAVEGLITGRQALKLMLAALVGKTSEAVANTLVIRDANDTADRITATMDANRYRTGVVLNP